MPRVLPAPDPNPPYDAVDRAWIRPGGESVGQGVLPLKFAAAIPRSRRPAPDGPDIAAMQRAGALTRAVAEALSGTRPPVQLRYGFTGNAHRRLLLAVRLSPGRYAVPTIHVQPVAPRALEVAATLRGAGHSHLLALRLEVRHERWVCTHLDTGFLPRQR
ncbi:MAG: Rv3235 family protein [Sporichthyaceae bacterium]